MAEAVSFSVTIPVTPQRGLAMTGI